MSNLETEFPRILLFAGTTEGRELAEYLAECTCSVIACVATEYGQTLIHERPGLRVHAGRLDEQQMEEMLLALKDADGKELYTEKNFAQ